MRLSSPDRWIEPVVGLAAALSIGLDWSVDLWSARAPWVPAVYQDVLVEATDLALAAIAGYALLAGRGAAERRFPVQTKVAGLAGGLLLVFLTLSSIGAGAPLLSIATTVHVGLGVLAYLAVIRRPGLARWILIGFGCLILLELPLIVLQETTQSRFPLALLAGAGADPGPASAPGAAVAFGPNGARWQRAMGSFPHPNVLGGFLAMGLVLALPLRERLDRSWRAVWLITWTLGWLELILSFSRAALLAALVAGGIWLLGRRGQTRGRLAVARLLIPPAVALVGAAVVVGPFLLPRLAPTPAVLSTTPVSSRLLVGSVAGAFILAHPILGVGAGNFSLAELAPPFDAVAVDPVHVVPLLVAAEAGVPAGLAWLAFVVGGPIADSWRRRFDAASLAELALPAAVLILALLDHYLWTLGAGRAVFWLGLAIWAAEMWEWLPTGPRPLILRDEAARGSGVPVGSPWERIAR